MNNESIIAFSMPKIDWKARHGTELNNGERLAFEQSWHNNIIKQTAIECIIMLQYKIVRNGSTPENIRTRDHINDIAKRFSIDLPIPNEYYERYDQSNQQAYRDAI